MEMLEILNKLNVDLKDFGQLYTATLGRVFAVQKNIEEKIIKKQGASINFQESKVKLGDSLYDIQYIGCDAEKKAWLWGWDEKSTFPSALFELSNKMKQFGIDNDALYCKNPRYDLPNEQFGRFLSGAMTSVFGYGYHKINTEKGGLYVAFTNLNEEIFSKVDELTFINISKHCFQTNQVDHKLFLEAFLLWNDISYKYEEGKLIADFPRTLIVNFTEDSKVSTVNLLEAKA